jgi:NAD-specific glutamate dehydrogenase
MIAELTGQPVELIARAWYRAMAAVDGWELRAAIEASSAPIDARYRAWVAVTDAVQALVTVWLAPGEPGPDGEDVETIRSVVARLGRTKSSDLEARLRARRDQHADRGLPRKLAERIAALGELIACREIALLNDGSERMAATLVRYMAVGEASRVYAAIDALSARGAEGGWDPVAIGILRTRYLHLLRGLVEALRIGPEVRLGIDRVATRLYRDELKDLRAMMDHMLGERPDLAALLVAEERVRGWIARQSEAPAAR